MSTPNVPFLTHNRSEIEAVTKQLLSDGVTYLESLSRLVDETLASFDKPNNRASEIGHDFKKNARHHIISNGFRKLIKALQKQMFHRRLFSYVGSSF